MPLKKLFIFLFIDGRKTFNKNLLIIVINIKNNKISIVTSMYYEIVTV